MSDLQWALNDLNPQAMRQQLYALYSAYYEGYHRMAFATEKFQSTFWRVFIDLADNLCSSVVDVQSEQLEIVGFSTNKATTQTVTVERDGARRQIGTIDDATALDLWTFWEKKDLDLSADEIHRNSLLFGDGFAIVWDDENQEPVIWPQPPDYMAVRYSQEYWGKIEVAAKMFTDFENHTAVNLYYADRIEHYRSKNPRRSDVGGGETYKEGQYELVGIDNHDLGIVPVFHFPNKACYDYGVSELRDVIPLQDALNKTLADMLVAQEFQAFRQRWITGIDVQLDEDGRPINFDFEHGADRMLVLPPDSATGAFEQGSTADYMTAAREFRAEIARVTGVPLHYFFVASAETPSGEALKTAELRFMRKLRAQQRLFGKQWENVLGTILKLQAGGTFDESLDINAQWKDTTPRSETELYDNWLKKQMLGVPISQIQLEMGYDPEQILQFAEESDVGLVSLPPPTTPEPPPPPLPPEGA